MSALSLVILTLKDCLASNALYANWPSMMLDIKQVVALTTHVEINETNKLAFNQLIPFLSFDSITKYPRLALIDLSSLISTFYEGPNSKDAILTWLTEVTKPNNAQITFDSTINPFTQSMPNLPDTGQITNPFFQLMPTQLMPNLPDTGQPKLFVFLSSVPCHDVGICSCIRFRDELWPEIKNELTTFDIDIVEIMRPMTSTDLPEGVPTEINKYVRTSPCIIFVRHDQLNVTPLQVNVFNGVVIGDYIYRAETYPTSIAGFKAWLNKLITQT